MRFRGPAVLATTSLLVAACAGTRAVPAEQFEQDEGDERLVLLADQRRAALEEVTLPRGTQHARLRMDCIGTGGEIEVEVDELGTAGVPCGEESSPDGFVGLSRLAPLSRDTSVRIRVTAPHGSHWSAAVDVGPGRLPLDEQE